MPFLVESFLLSLLRALLVFFSVRFVTFGRGAVLLAITFGVDSGTPLAMQFLAPGHWQSHMPHYIGHASSVVELPQDGEITTALPRLRVVDILIGPHTARSVHGFHRTSIVSVNILGIILDYLFHQRLQPLKLLFVLRFCGLQPRLLAVCLWLYDPATCALGAVRVAWQRGEMLHDVGYFLLEPAAHGRHVAGEPLLCAFDQGHHSGQIGVLLSVQEQLDERLANTFLA